VREKESSRERVHPLFQEFEKEIYLKNLIPENTIQEENYSDKKSNITSSGINYTKKKKNLAQEYLLNSYLLISRDIYKIEDFLLEVQRIISSSRGVLPSNLNPKIQSLLNSKPIVNKVPERRTEKGFSGLPDYNEEPKSSTKSESAMVRRELELLSHEFIPKNIEVISFFYNDS
jgi:hypothetical protein